ncbi:hypothetical protein CXR34_08815 [Microbacterium hominis]|uniref:Uncharacterized protein n=1 Tax=Microbacterium hominis TaxID=162426 RepID=A0A2K9DMD6_9MICO|nr:hypothetical protein CXR34_08815 [Microbacterium hominis]
MTRWHRGQGRRVLRMTLKQGLQVAPPVNRTLTRAVRPQCTQGSTFPGAHSGQSGPAAVVVCTRRALPQRLQDFFASGSRRRQLLQSGFPPRRRQTRRILPQSLHSSARSTSVQGLQMRRSSGPRPMIRSRPHRSQTGTTTACPLSRTRRSKRCTIAGVIRSPAWARSVVVRT